MLIRWRIRLVATTSHRSGRAVNINMANLTKVI